MAVTIPGVVIPWIETRFFDINGVPLAGGFVYAYEAGTSTPKDTYSDSDLTTPNTNPVELDAYGRATIYIAPGGYKFIVKDADLVTQYTFDDVEDVGQTLFNSLGTVLATGSTNVSSGYTVLSTDQLVTVASTGGANPCIVNLPAAADRGLPLLIKNLGTIALEVRPDGSDTIDGLSTYTVAAASSPSFPTIQLLSDGVSSWYVVASF